MKQLYFTFLALVLTCMFGYAQVDVTFTVDMSNETVDSAGVNVAGSFNGWSNTLMTDNGDGTWSVTVSLMEGSAEEYKFKNGNDGWENFSGPCTTDGGFGNRAYTVAATADTLATVCFNSCFACGTEGVTLTVDMSNETVDAAGVFFAGDLNGWGNDPLTDNGDGTWSITIGVATGETTTYKFKNGTDGWEGFDGPCLQGGAFGNRFVVGPTADSTAATVCFNSCDPCSTVGGPSNVTFTVDMSNETVDTAGVFMAGGFNGWSNDAMTDNGDGTWSLTLELTAGETVEYKFKNGNDGWENFDGPCLTNGSGSNRYVNVPDADATLGTVCFNSCVGCGMVAVGLTVDMQFETIADEGVFLAGAHNGWTDGAMSDNGDGTWSGYFGIMPGDTSEYKFKNGPNGWENFDGDCLIGGSGSNRFISASDDISAETVCFNQCDPCIVYDTIDLTIRVDMTEQVVEPEGVFIAGSFNGFTDQPMINMGDSIWAITLKFAPGDTITYKFKNGPNGWEAIAGTDCTDGSFANNRFTVVPPQPTTLDAVCFGKCSICFDPYSVSSSALLEGSCRNTDGTVTIVFDETLNCDVVAGELGGMAEIGFHTGVTLASTGSSWQNVVAWDEAGAQSAVNDGNDKFSVTIDVASYYGVDAADVVKLDMVFNQGPSVPGSPWESEGKDADLDENGSCDDIRLFLADLPTCNFDPGSTSSASIKSAGSCHDPNYGLIRVSFDEAQNCPTAPGDLAGMNEIGFHSGANSWSNVVAWDDAGAMTAVNDGNNVFSLVLDPVAYYGLASFGDLQNIYMVFNQGPEVPGSPWDSEGKDADLNGDGSCDDLRFIVSDLPTCDLTNTIDRELENSLVAIPNPFSNRTIVSFSNPGNATYNVTLMSLTGQQIQSFKNVNGNRLEIERSTMPAGMYFLNFRNEEGKMATLKLVVQ